MAGRILHFRFLMLLLGVFALGSAALAQSDLSQPIAVGDNRVGQITETAPVVHLMLAVEQPQRVTLQVLSMTPGMGPAFSVVDPSGVALLTVDNLDARTVVEGSAPLTAPGNYDISVSSASGVLGQFLISIQPGAPLEAAEPLAIGASTHAGVSAQAPHRAYHITGSPTDALLLTVRSSSADAGPVVTLRDVATGEMLAMTAARLSGMQVRLPPAVAEYQVDVSHSGSAAGEDFIVCLESENQLPTCPLRQQTAFLPLPDPSPTTPTTGTQETASAPTSQPVYGSTAISSGFIPDPFSTGVATGGPDALSQRGNACSGYATAAPTFSLDYTAGAFPVLRFYFIGPADTTMLISGPDGNTTCIDDSFDTFNPSIDFSSPDSGRYDVWIGATTANASVEGTLYITEDMRNHP